MNASVAGYTLIIFNSPGAAVKCSHSPGVSLYRAFTDATQVLCECTQAYCEAMLLTLLHPKKTAPASSITPRMLLAGIGTVLISSVWGQGQSVPGGHLPADPKIAAALKDVSAEQIRGSIEKLVSFGTRLTLSAQDPASIAAGHGIGAAREWIKSEFERYSRDCGGCLDVKADSFTQAPADRIPKATEITNVYAVLRGTDPENAKRVVLVTGHYDSRNSDTLDVN